jgi:hypothetical protein
VCNSVHEVYYYLERFPDGIHALYDEAWKRATGGNDARKSQQAKNILMWVSVAAKPLSVKALGEALSASQRETYDEALLTQDEIIAACAGLVHIQHWPDGSRGRSKLYITLSHLSVQEYLDSNRQALFPGADDAMVDACSFYSSSSAVYEALSTLSDDRRYHHPPYLCM